MSYGPKRGTRFKHARFMKKKDGSIVWSIWCGWCERDHQYSARYLGRDEAESIHDLHMYKKRKETEGLGSGHPVRTPRPSGPPAATMKPQGGL